MSWATLEKFFGVTFAVWLAALVLAPIIGAACWIEYVATGEVRYADQGFLVVGLLWVAGCWVIVTGALAKGCSDIFGPWRGK